MNNSATGKASSSSSSSSTAVATATATGKSTGKATASTAAAGAPNSKRQEKTKAAEDDVDDMMALLKKHNQRFASAPVYEPPRHSVRDVRKWEKQTGKTWAKLNPEEREAANSDISRMKEF
jgi:predicted 2-oxoglutarate/Fe(II)-dependent dioxygenase YbiX